MRLLLTSLEFCIEDGNLEKAKELVSKYAYKTELHSHTYPVSACGQTSAEESVRIHKDAGVNTLVISNHLTDYHLVGRTIEETAEFYLSDYYKAREAAKSLDIDVVLGCELKFEGTRNDYLIYGICPDDIERIVSYIPRGIEEFYKDFKNDKNVIIHAHPRRANMDPTPYGYVDGVEVFNMHPGLEAKVVYTAKDANDRGLLVTGGSDFHVCHPTLTKQANCLMRTKSRLRDSYDVAEAIKSRDVIFDIFGNVILPYFMV